MSHCGFCDIAQGVPAPGCIYRDEHVFLLLDRESLAFGHCMLVPTIHVNKVYNLPPERCRLFFAFAAESASKLERALGVKAVGLVAFGSGLEHAHLHLVPHDDPDVLTHPMRYIRRKTEDDLTEDGRRLARLVSFGA